MDTWYERIAQGHSDLPGTRLRAAADHPRLSAVDDGLIEKSPVKIRGAGYAPRRHEVEPASNHPSVRDRACRRAGCSLASHPQAGEEVERVAYLDRAGTASTPWPLGSAQLRGPDRPLDQSCSPPLDPSPRPTLCHCYQVPGG